MVNIYIKKNVWCWSEYKFLRQKNVKRKSTMQLFINNNARFYYQSKEKVLSSNALGRMQLWTKKDKIENLTDDDLEKSLSDNEADNDYNDETESDNE